MTDDAIVQEQSQLVTAQGIARNAPTGLFGQTGVPSLGAEAAAALLGDKPKKAAKDKKDKAK
jgi:hypothetical protein